MAVFAWVWSARPVPGELAGVGSPSALVSAPEVMILNDGSRVELREGAKIAVNFEGTSRRIILERGEAHFQVAKNAARPFVVTAGKIEVRAVGTAFSVQLGARAVGVLVTEGRVAVAKPGARAGLRAPDAAPVFVDEGCRVVVETAAPAATPPPLAVAVSADERSALLAWRVPRLEFSATPLSEAVAMFNRYNPPARLSFDPSLGGLAMSGTLRADDIDSLFLFLKNEFGIEPERRGEGGVLLRRR